MSDDLELKYFQSRRAGEEKYENEIELASLSALYNDLRRMYDERGEQLAASRAEVARLRNGIVEVMVMFNKWDLRRDDVLIALQKLLAVDTAHASVTQE